MGICTAVSQVASRGFSRLSNGKYRVCTYMREKKHPQIENTHQETKWLLTSSVLPGLNSIFLELGT